MSDLLATVDDLIWRPLTNPQELANAQAWLRVASAQVRNAVTDVDSRIAADQDYAVLVRGIVAAAVVRALRGQDTRDRADFSTSLVWPSELAQLLTTGSTETSNLPVGSFPCAQAWPDPAYVCYPRYS